MKRTILTRIKSPLIYFLFAGSILAAGCGQSKNNEAEGEVASATADAADGATSADAATDSPLGSRPAYVPPKATQAPLTLGISNQRIKSGSPLCLDVQVADFTQLLSMQYSVRWDPAMLQFKSVQNFQLAGLGPEDFGAHRSAEGILTSVWIDDQLQGVTLTDGSTVYQICFQVVGAAGQTTEVSLSDGPTPFEAVNLKEEVVDIKGVAGRVTIN